MEKNNNTTSWIIGGIVVILLIIAGVMLFSGSETDEVDGSENNNNNNEEESFESVSGDESNSVIVNTQLPGDVVFYDNLTLEEDGFVVIRNEVDGEPGDVIGSHYREAGSDMNGNVELDEQTVEGEHYYVELYSDQNGNEVFEETEDDKVTTASGDVIRVRIEATEDLPEQKG